MVSDSRFLREEPLGEGVVDAAGRQERGGDFPLLFLNRLVSPLSLRNSLFGGRLLCR